MNTANLRTTVAVSKDTKAKMDKWRAEGQCYDGFLCQLVDLWERMHKGSSMKPKKSLTKSKIKATDRLPQGK